MDSNKCPGAYYRVSTTINIEAAEAGKGEGGSRGSVGQWKINCMDKSEGDYITYGDVLTFTSSFINKDNITTLVSCDSVNGLDAGCSKANYTSVTTCLITNIKNFAPGEQWELIPTDSNLDNILGKYQTNSHFSNCQLLSDWDNPEINWYYGGLDYIDELKSNNSIFYAKENEIVLVPPDTCVFECGSQKIDICKSINSKILNCKSNNGKCKGDISYSIDNSYKPKDINPKCFYSIPIGTGDGKSKIININNEKKKITGLKCDKSVLYNNKVIDNILYYQGSVLIFLGVEVYSMIPDKTTPNVYKLEDDSPKKITEYFPGIKGSIDAVVEINDTLIFFKDDIYYHWVKGKITKGIIRNIWLGVPSGIDTACYTTINNVKTMCFTKNSICYCVPLNKAFGPYKMSSGSNLYLCDGYEGNKTIQTYTDAVNFAKEFSGELATIEEISDTIKTVPVMANYNGWTLNDKNNPYSVSTSHHLTKSSSLKGGIWCKIYADQFILGGKSYKKKLNKILVNSPNYIDGLVLNTPSDNFIIKDDMVYEVDNNRNVLLNKSTSIHLKFPGLPKKTDIVKQANDETCKTKQELNNKINDANFDYNGNTKILSRGYGSINYIDEYLGRLTKKSGKNDHMMNQANLIQDTKRRVEEISENSEYKRTVHIVLLKITLIALLFTGFFLSIGAIGNYNFTKGKYYKSIFILIGIVYLYYFISITTRLKKGSKNRYTLLQWAMTKEDKEIMNLTNNTNLSDNSINLEKECKLLKREEDRLNKQQESDSLKDFIHLKDTKLIDSGMHVLNDKNGNLNGKKLKSFGEARHLVNSLPYADGIIKSKGKDHYNVFRLKTHIGSVRRSENGSNVYVKQGSHSNVAKPKVHNSIKNDVKPKGKCPSLYPHPFKNGKMCCQGKVSSIGSDKCPSENYIPCSKPPCSQSELLNVSNDVSNVVSDVSKTVSKTFKKGISELENIF